MNGYQAEMAAGCMGAIVRKFAPTGHG